MASGPAKVYRAASEVRQRDHAKARGFAFRQADIPLIKARRFSSGLCQAAVCATTPAASSKAVEMSRMLITPASEKFSITGRCRM